MQQNNPEPAHPAAVAQEFMKRCDLKGAEVEAFAQTFNWLAEIVSEATVVVTKDAFDDLMEAYKERQERQESLKMTDKDAPIELEAVDLDPTVG